ncbi:hypothetical protein [Nocardia abscessus]|uniref:hypothetical protein n=1 Tax=Nocardia abscessus TaxID=120957 RepID=UPI002455EFA1|nr:hypothetical protein [Nocardia abscessus]
MLGSRSAENSPRFVRPRVAGRFLILWGVGGGWLAKPAPPDRMREILTEHIAYAEKMRRRAEADAQGAEANPDWAYPELVLRWCVRHYEAERDFARELLADIDRLTE